MVCFCPVGLLGWYVRPCALLSRSVLKNLDSKPSFLCTKPGPKVEFWAVGSERM